MNRNLLEQHLLKSGFDDMQSSAIADILEDTATRQDVEALRAEMRSEFALMRGEMAGLHRETERKIEKLRADLTWRFVALVTFLATVSTLVGLFAG